VVHNASVLDLNYAANALGITRGMSVGEAKLLSDGRGLIPFQPDQFAAAQKAWLDICALLTNIIEPDEFHTAYLDLSGHSLSREDVTGPTSIAQKLADMIGETGLTAQIGIAGTRWVAKLDGEANYHEISNRTPTALLTPRRFVSGFPTWQLPLEHQVTERLSFLGYKTIGEVAGIPLEVLQKQFGTLALDIKRYANGGGDPTVRALYPPNSITESFRFDGCPETYECFEHSLKTLSSRIAGKLLDEDWVGESLDLIIEHESGKVTSQSRTFSKPYHSAKSLWASVKLLVPIDLFQKMESERLENVRLRAKELRKLDRVQMDLDISHVKSHQNEKVGNAVRHVHQVFGLESVRLGCQIQESRRQLVLRAWRNAYGWT
jgi:nucleotidyltransferase/DNA polymerase involved in DNA repair